MIEQGIIVFLIGQLVANIWMLFKLTNRLTRVEVHQLHIMRALKINLWDKETPADYEHMVGD